MAIKFNRSQTFATNGTVDAPSLHNLVDSLNIYQSLITDQTNVTSVSTADELLIAIAAGSTGDAPKAVTVHDLFEDALTAGTYTNANISAALTYGTATGTRLVSANATITTGTITTGVIPSLTAGTTTSTAATITSGTITNLASTTGTIATLNSTTGTITTLVASAGTFAGSLVNVTTGTIGNLSTTLTGDVTISAGVATASTATVAKLASAQEYTAAHNFNATTLTSGNSIAWNLQSNQVARLVLSTTGTMADATNKVDGATYILLVTQGTGSNTLDWNATYKWPGNTKPILTTGSGKSDIFTFISDGTSLFGATSKNYS
jgi:hypothetical protein